eukprot:447062-Rhodomonas_salina.1
MQERVGVKERERERERGERERDREAVVYGAIRPARAVLTQRMVLPVSSTPRPARVYELAR